jgi:hypothetical protein
MRNLRTILSELLTGVLVVVGVILFMKGVGL